MVTITVLPWRHDSELAFVRDCFFPQHVPSRQSDIDVYAAPVIDGLENGEDDDEDVMDFSISGPTIYANTVGLRQEIQGYNAGLRRVGIWTFRSPRSVPHAVTATAGLVESKLHDMGGFDRKAWNSKRQEEGFRISETALRSIYAMAFLKFVNGFVDRDVSRSTRRTGLSKIAVAGGGEEDEDADEAQPVSGLLAAKGAGESSMYAHAVTIGMPSQFVDMRHRCVHGEVPELAVLRRMNGRALDWLWDRWWKGNATGESGRFKWEMECAREIEQSLRDSGNSIRADESGPVDAVMGAFG